ncbi:MAG: twin-arginine translocation signal domain-containing protein, partial [Planctomycetota bacterium]
MKTNRRSFLKAAAALAASGPLTKLPRAFAAAPGSLKSGQKITLPATGLKIKSIESFTKGHVSIVKITTDDGSTGFGQISTYDADISATVLHRKIAHLALGADPANIDDLVDKCI